MSNPKGAGVHPIIQCRELTKIFEDGARQIQVLNQIDFILQPQERVAIIGASGSGKSTFLHILGTLEQASSGELSIMGHSITKYKHHQSNQLRNRYIGFIYQFHHLLPEFTLFENVAMPLLLQGEAMATIRHQAWHILEQLGLAGKAHHKPGEVSGGEKQRTAIGRAMITKPALILADEPTGNLDNIAAHQAIETLCQTTSTSLIIVTHNDSIAQRMDRILQLKDGQLFPIASL